MPSGRRLTLVIVCLAQFMVVLDATIVNVALPSIQRDLAFSPADLQWVVNGYTLVFGGFLLLGGRAADLVGRRRLFQIGLALFSVASLGCGFAESPEVLVAARALQGLGAALVSPAALSIVTTTFREGPERTGALGAWGAIAAGGGAFGLLLGGFLTESLSWEWTFYINVPVGIAVMLLARRFVPESRATTTTRGFDLAGAVSVTAGLIVVTYAIVKAEAFGWGDPRTLGLFALGLGLLAAFVAVERRSAAPLVRLGVFGIRSLATANGVMLLVTGALFSFFFFGTLYVQEVLGFGPLEAGLAFLPLTAGIIVGAGLAQRMIRAVGLKPPLLIGMVASAAGLMLLSGIPVDGSYAADVLPGLLLIAVGMGNTFVPLTLAATANLSSDDQGLASGIFNTAQQIGGALGLAVLSTLAAERATSTLGELGRAPAPADQAQALVNGFQLAFSTGAILMSAGAILLVLLLRRADVAGLQCEPAVLVPAAAAETP